MRSGPSLCQYQPPRNRHRGAATASPAGGQHDQAFGPGDAGVEQVVLQQGVGAHRQRHDHRVLPQLEAPGRGRSDFKAEPHPQAGPRDRPGRAGEARRREQRGAGAGLAAAVAAARRTWPTRFERLRSGTFGALHERVEARPRELRIGRMRVKPLFAPRHGPEKQMIQAGSGWTSRCSPFAQFSGIDDTMAGLVGERAASGVGFPS